MVTHHCQTLNNTAAKKKKGIKVRQLAPLVPCVAYTFFFHFLLPGCANELASKIEFDISIDLMHIEKSVNMHKLSQNLDSPD